MKIAFVTNLRAPYRTLQVNEFSKIKDVNINVYYTDKPSENRVWNVNKVIGFKEIDLKGYNLFGKYGYINKGLVDIVKSHDLLILGGYEKPTYIALSILCKFFKKPYILLFDGISTNRLDENENPLKKFVKNIVVKRASFILGNGEVSKRYFSEVFSYPRERIYNQYLTVDTNKIGKLYKEKEKYKKEYKESLGIKQEDRVLIYSGRLIDIKNVERVIEAIAKIRNENIVFLIVGGGILENYLKKRARDLNVNIIITGFLADQEEVFKHYFVGDAMILPSIVEPWGLVINEGLVAGMPVIVSKYCGCANDLVVNKKNGYLVNPFNVDQISNCIEKIMYKDDRVEYSRKSKEIASEWTFENSRKSLEKILKHFKIY
ncbi:TPA: glycosyltransferase family 4 protein [Bacillus thuringiensis]|nr:glycosyltransferase family 4 protein [Bacillus thuringiensis]